MTKQTTASRPKYEITHRTWFTRGPNGEILEQPGEPVHVGFAATKRDARAQCLAWAARNPAGELFDCPMYEPVTPA